MYEQHFGLDRRPFRATAIGADVFVGPQTAQLLTGAKKAMAASDAAIAVIGAAGVGKTTLVNRFIDAVADETHVVRIGRLKLRHDEVLDFLLEEFDAAQIPDSTIRKMTLFKKLLAERCRAGARAIFIVEDAVRIGEDALAEIEALTAADAHDGKGATLFLMGDESLRDLLDSESLARLRQRVRLFNEVSPLAVNEFKAYLKHGLRAAGAEFDRLFCDGSAELLHALTGGVPRITNSLVESILIAGCEQKMTRIEAALISRIAAEEYGLCAVPANTDAAETSPATEVAETSPDIEAAEPSPDTKAAEETQSAEPRPAHHTLPDLEILAPKLAGAGSGTTGDPDEADTVARKIADDDETVLRSLGDDDETVVRSLDDENTGDEEEIPTLYSSDMPQADDDAPSSEELEELANSALGFEPSIDFGALLAPDAGSAGETGADPSGTGPANSLDKAIENDIAVATEALKKHDATISEESGGKFRFEAVPRQERPGENATAEVESGQAADPVEAGQADDSTGRQRVAHNLSKAQTLADVDDQMAESLFDTRIGLLASKHASARATVEPGGQDRGQSAEAPADIELKLVEDEPPPGKVEVSVTPAMLVPTMPLTASQRLATVMALNARQRAAGQSSAPAASRQPPIEDQINKQIPTTLDELNVGRHPANDDDADEDRKKSRGGFFGRFRRS